MDYENVKAVLFAVLQRWKEEDAKPKIYQWDPNNHSGGSTSSVDLVRVPIAEQFCNQVLEQLKTSYDIWKAQR
jgi:hypothetical protein